MSTKYYEELVATAAALAAPGKGLLAADESTGTIGKRFQKINLENTEENRRAYRELLFTAPGNFENYISGVIMFEETLYQRTKDGIPFVEVLKQKGVYTGIKVDKGVVVLPGTDGENATTGLDGLAERCQKYYQAGARFAKWRAVLKIGSTCPSELSVIENSHTLARYAAICQENGLVPIVEPEVLMDGDHDIKKCASVTERVLAATFKALHDHHVILEGILLKPNMVLAGEQSSTKPSPVEVAKYTVKVLQRTVPPAVPGIMFLSGGQSEEEATMNLDAMNRLKTKRPWSLTFSYGRALQATCLKVWKGEPSSVTAAQEAFITRARANSQAQLGQYEGGSKLGVEKESLYERDYVY